MPQIQINAPAKLNLHLEVGALRPDGFHDINSLFLALDFCDTLDISVGEGGSSLALDMRFPAGYPFPDIPHEKNIISRAVSLFRSRTGFDEGLKITVEKRIPPGGGLGGGSSNAAATLLALNRLASDGPGGGLGNENLLEMGAALGSDIPFFLKSAESGKNAAVVGGRGELVQPFSLPEEVRGLSFVLVNPGFPSDTAKAYRLLDEYRENGKLGIRNEELAPHSSLLISNSPEKWCFFNDFLPVFEAAAAEPVPGNSRGAVYREVISGLKAAGAGFAGLSGSGSTCFGVFTSPEEAGKAKESFLKQGFCTYETFPLAYWSIQYYN